MIAYVKGIIAHKDGYGVILEANGIGYEMSMSSKALGTLPAVGNTAQVWTYLHVKDDGMSLFGFCDAAEKEMFVKLIGVSGIGPKMAISALSTFNPKELASAIAAGDVTSDLLGAGRRQEDRAARCAGAAGHTQVGSGPVQRRRRLGKKRRHGRCFRRTRVDGLHVAGNRGRAQGVHVRGRLRHHALCA